MAPLPPPRSPRRSLLQQAAPGRQAPSRPLHGPWAAAAGKVDTGSERHWGPTGPTSPTRKGTGLGPKAGGHPESPAASGSGAWPPCATRGWREGEGSQLPPDTVGTVRPLPSSVPAHTCPPQIGEAPVIKRRAPGLTHSRPSMLGCFSSLHCLPPTCYSQGQMREGEKRRPGKGGVVSAASMRPLKPPSA